MSHPLPARPSLSLLKNQAKTLRKACSSNLPDARLRVQTYHPAYSKSVPEDLSLRDAQLVVAREYGFESWSELRHKVEVEAEKIDFQRHKAERIKSCTSSPDEIAQVLQDACGSLPKRTERITADYSNEVHRVETEDGQTVIYRANWYCHTPHFEREKWALDACGKVGVPTPEMLYLSHDFEGHPKRSVCVLSFVAGQPLRAILNQKAISDKDYRHVLYQAGELYGRLHTVNTDGFLALDGKGCGEKNDWVSAYVEDLDRERLMLAAHNAEISDRLIENALHLLDVHNTIGCDVSPVLLHGDFGLPHMMVQDEQLTALIDFEYCEGGDPAKETDWGGSAISIWWDRFTGHDSPKIPTNILLEGYGRVQKVDDAFLKRSEWFHLLGCLAGLCYHGVQDMNMAGMMPFLNWRFKLDFERARKHLG